MKKSLFLVLLLLPLVASSQHTFSIVAVDAETGEIGSAGATCLFFDNAARDISDIVLGVGGVHTQAYWTLENQAIARERMVAGDTPDEIIQYLQDNDNGASGGNINDRQYGVVTLNDGSPQAAAYTGSENFDVKGHRLGSNYSIQGNILISEEVLDDMEAAFQSADGPMCDKLMAVLQAAKRPGADQRCLDEGISSGSAFIRVAKPTDTSSDYGDLWLDIELFVTGYESPAVDPIDLLQVEFDAFKEANSVREYGAIDFELSPNPSTGIITIDHHDQDVSELRVTDLMGRLILQQPMTQSPMSIDLGEVADGQYILSLIKDDLEVGQAKFMLKKD